MHLKVGYIREQTQKLQYICTAVSGINLSIALVYGMSPKLLKVNRFLMVTFTVSGKCIYN